MIDKSDSQLINEYLGGEERSLDLLVAKYFRRLYSFIYSLTGSQKDAEDLTQEAFVKAWRSLKKFDREKNFRTWLFTIAKNCAIDQLRRKKPLLFSELENDEGISAIDQLADTSPLPSEQAEQIISHALLNQSLDKLPLKQHSVIALYYQNDLNFREIAEIMDEPINTVKSRHRRALLALQQTLNRSNI